MGLTFDLFISIIFISINRSLRRCKCDDSNSSCSNYIVLLVFRVCLHVQIRKIHFSRWHGDKKRRICYVMLIQHRKYLLLDSAFFGKVVPFGSIAFWFTVQFFCHWYYTIFGASEKKLKGYNDCFKNTVHIIPASKTKLIPDLYHMILHLLILLNIVLVLCNIFI